MTLCALAQSHFADTYALNPINMPRLHMTASDWKSDIGPANLNNIHSSATHDSHFQLLSQMYWPAPEQEYKKLNTKHGVLNFWGTSLTCHG